MYKDYLETPIGCIEVEASDQGVSRVIFVESPSDDVCNNNWTDRCKQQLSEYFSGERQEFDLALDQQQGTVFQRSIWSGLTTIPFGQSATYLDVANMVNNPKAVRAVGAANGRNPISIIVPCHRVIGSNGKLTGYAGGMERKAWLLRHEKIQFI